MGVMRAPVVAMAGVLVVVVALFSGVPSVAAQSGGPFRGVNLGGWLVLESWMSPSLFAAHNVASGSGEWEFCEAVGPGAACGAALKQHWDTWVTQDHISQLAASGVTHVRIPVGYWIIADAVKSGEPYCAGCGWPYLVRALGWLKSAGISAVLDLHGAPGSQNGHDNSGQSSGGIHWQDGDNVNRTVAVLGDLAARAVAINGNASTSGVVTGIELLNEPWTTQIGGPITLELLRSFYLQGFKVIRAAGFQADVWLHDGWALGDAGWQGFLSPPAAQNVYFDTHIYHAFGGARQAKSPWANVAYTCQQDLPMLSALTQQDWVIVGEWSLATGPGSPATPAGTSWLRAFWQAQVQAYCPSCWAPLSGSAPQPARGAFFWNFRIETGYEEWNYLLGYQNGWIPSGYGSNATNYDLSCADMCSA